MDESLHHKNTLPAEEGPDCLLCAVRALTEGEPRPWFQADMPPGSYVSGVVLRVGYESNRWSLNGERVRFVDLWLGGHARVRVWGYGGSLDAALYRADAKVGDRLTVTYTGTGVVQKGLHAGREYRMFTTDVNRGHH